MTPPLAFYCVSSAEYFLGAAGLVNSLRLAGHDEPVHLLDCGLAGGQREALEAGGVHVLSGPQGVPPQLLKGVAPLAHPAETMVLIDADMLVNRSLAPLVENTPADGVAAPGLPMERFFAEWSEPLGGGTCEAHPYLTSGFVILRGTTGAEVASLLHEGRDAVDVERTFMGSGTPEYPFHYADQDLLNAILATRVPGERVVRIDERAVAMVPYDELTPRDAGNWGYPDGSAPFLLHHVFEVKPWKDPLPHGVYSKALSSALFAADAPVRVPPRLVPLRLRPGAMGSLDRARRRVAGIRAGRRG